MLRQTSEISIKQEPNKIDLASKIWRKLPMYSSFEANNNFVLS